MTYIVHGARGSGSSVVEAACAEIGADYRVRDLDIRAGEHREQAYGALNPQHKLPTLEIEGGEVISESVAILLTLDERHRDAGLMPPPGSQQRAQALRWMLFAATELYPIIEIIDYPERFTNSADGVPGVQQRAKDTWHERWRVVERNLQGSPYWVDTGFCATDLYVAMLSRWDMEPAWRREHLPRVEALADAVRVRPAVAPVWARHFP